MKQKSPFFRSPTAPRAPEHHDVCVGGPGLLGVTWRTRRAGCCLLLVLSGGQRPSAGFGMNILYPLGADSDWDVCLCIFAYTPTRVIKQHFSSSASCLCPTSPVMASFISLPFVLAVFFSVYGGSFGLGATRCDLQDLLVQGPSAQGSIWPLLLPVVLC